MVMLMDVDEDVDAHEDFNNVGPACCDAPHTAPSTGPFASRCFGDGAIRFTRMSYPRRCRSCARARAC